MLNSETIISTVKKQLEGIEIDPPPRSLFNYDIPIRTIPQSIVCTLARLNDCTTPYVDAQLIERRLVEKEVDGEKVETAIWPFFTYHFVYGLDGKKEYFELVIDAHGKLLGRGVTQIQGEPDRYSRISVYEPGRLSPEQQLRVLYELDSKRSKLKVQSVPSFV